jgi:magnesium chelatase family protein
MLAKRVPTILPTMAIEEAIETTKIHSVAGLVPPKTALIATRPYRSPHHTISDSGLIGGGLYPRAGEVSLAHNGVLFLDELPEFKRNVLEAMRQPLEDGFITVSRKVLSVTYPSRFMLIGAMNPCPCGNATDSTKVCQCTSSQIQRYLSRISGPLLDRIDIHIEVPSVKVRELSGDRTGESSVTIRERTNRARKIQTQRFAGRKGIYCNAQMTTKDIKKYCGFDKDCLDLIELATNRLGLSARAYDRILKVSRTIADLDGKENITVAHLSEAIQYRSLDKLLK